MSQTNHKENILLGMFCAMAAFMLFTVMNMLGKMLATDHDVFEISFFRNAVAMVPFALIACAKGKPSIKVHNKKGVFIRGVVGVITMFVTFGAFIAMPLAETTAFLFTASLFVPILSVIILKEKVGWHRWAAVFIGFVGVLIMLQPSGNINVLGVCLALTAALLQGLMAILLRHLGASDQPFAITFYFMVIGVTITGLILPFVFDMPSWENWWKILGIGISGACAQFSLATAYKNAPASVVTIFNYSGIIWATLFGYLIWGDWPNDTIIIGGAIVIISNLFILYRERKNQAVKPVKPLAS